MQSATHMLVSGRVQGVGFRNFTLNVALRMGIKGWVRNLTDERVEVLAIGEKDQIENFIKSLHQGPPRSMVESIVTDQVLLKEELNTFTVKVDGDRQWQS